MTPQAFKRVVIAVAAWNMFFGSLVMLGWILDLDILKDGLPGFITVRFNTAVAIFVIGLVFISHVSAGNKPAKRIYETAGALVVLLVSFLTLLEHSFGFDFGIDQFFYEQPLGLLDNGFPGRMGPNTGLCFVLTSLALLLLHKQDVWYQRLYQALTIVVFLTAFISLVAYIYDATAFLGARGYAIMAIYTAANFLSLTVGLFALRSNHGVGAILAQENFAGASVRTLLPMTIGAPIVVGWVCLMGEKAGYFTAEFGLALMVTLCVAILSAFVLWNARFQGAAEERNKRTESEKETLLEELMLIKVELEERVRLRTRELNRALVERDVLLQEVHHRVKNNLQVISSLINMQLRKLKSDAARPELEECRSRIFAISFIHQQLYQSKNYSDVAFPQYAKQLISYIAEAAGVLTAGISLEIHMEERPLSVDKAIPCGLILNELITNAFKHAFPAGSRGTIKVEWKKVEGDMLLLVEDDGIGMTTGTGGDESDSLGLLLVNTLAEQLGGQMEFRCDVGTRCLIKFPDEMIQ